MGRYGAGVSEVWIVLIVTVDVGVEAVVVAVVVVVAGLIKCVAVLRASIMVVVLLLWMRSL